MYSQEEHTTVQQTTKASQTTILELNADCLLKIFRYFNVGGMAIVADVCRRFQEIATEAFKYECKEKWVTLTNGDTESRLESTAILRNFGHELKKIFVVFNETRDDGFFFFRCCDQLDVAYAENRSSEFIENIFSEVYGQQLTEVDEEKRNDEFFDIIFDKCDSQQLTEVNISNKILSRDSIYRLNNKFVNIKSLAFEKRPFDENHVESIEQALPTLEHLILYGHEFENSNVLQCLSLNRHLKRIALRYRNDLQNARNLLESMDETLPQLEQLELAIDAIDNAEFRQYRPKFFKNLKRLKIWNFECGIDMQYLSISNEKIEELELKNGRCDEGVVTFICFYKEIKKLTISDIYNHMNYNELLELNKHLPKLTEFEISSCSENCNHEAIARFVLGSEQLVKFVIKDEKIKDISVVMIDIQRKLDSTKWTVDCYPSKNELIIRKL